MTPTLVYLATDRHIRHVTDPVDRAGLERWIIEFVAENPRFTVDQAVVVARQLAERWGFDVVADERRREELVQPVLYTEAEWLARGRVPDPGARPVRMLGSRRERFGCFLSGDVSPAPGAEESTRWPVVDALERSRHLRRRAHHLAPEYREFAEVLTDYELALLRHVWVIGAVVEWDDDPDYDTVGWIRNGPRDRRRLPRPDLTGDEALFRLLINPWPGEENVMVVILGLLAQILALTVLGRWRGAPVTGEDGEDGVTHPGELETGLIAHLVARRLGLDESVRDRGVRGYLHGEVPGPAPEGVRWNLVFETAEVLEDVLRGNSVFTWRAAGD
ncbi:hypothetical protein [Corynebacterium halotolerans]|uniref:Uncharacterized protein n=1 Tax=Corynebacterium halotolerans YIM 70093 = DSM 44683 TaxID=1121362 RepID=M1NRP8_9CORY|nr:hypothetical protein [Corynebacterium halotolerans]AGF72182.1 hypothetical protein A605_05880 [Corynebacterium halotolerans YIM 70093 = DSM 44683]